MRWWVSLGTSVGLCVVLGQGPVVHAQPQPSLAEVAKRERARRDGIKEKSRVYTNDDLLGGPRLTTGTPPPVAADSESREAGGIPPAPEGAVVTDTSTDQQVARDEDYWRERITTARDARRRAELMAAALQNRVDGLWADFTARDDPFQRAQIDQDRIAALQELENTRAEMVRLDQQIRDIQEEARRASVPPGWLR